MGECTVDLPLREIHAPDARRPLRVTPKTLGVLLALVDRAGQVTTREALLARVWPDTMPSDDVLTQAITQLRKAFAHQRADTPDEPRYIETIAKTGYRLVAPVRWLHGSEQDAVDQRVTTVADTAPASGDGARPNPPVALVVGAFDPAQVPLPPTHPRGGWRSIVVAVAVSLAVLLVVALWAQRNPSASEPMAVPSQLPRAEQPFRLITSARGFEQSPALSPDAAMVAYAARPAGREHTAIMVQTTAQSVPQTLTSPAPGHDDSAPAWSPDGREIAFLRVASDSCQVMVVAANGGGERTVAGCDPRSPPSFDWTPDGSGLLFGANAAAPGEAGIRELDLGTGDWRSLRYTYRRGDVDAQPRYSPDGESIVFVRNSPLGDFWRVPANGGQAERLTHLRADIRGWDWIDGGEGIVFGRLVNGDTRLFRLELGSTVPRDLGIANAFAPDTVIGSRALAFVQRKPYFGIFRVTQGVNPGVTGGVTPGGAPKTSAGAATADVATPDVERLFVSSGRDVMPVIAPDGRQLVFVSDRSGPNGLWWADLERPGSLRHIPGLQPDARHAPVWSVDSRRVLVVGSGGAAGSAGEAGTARAVYEVVPASGQVLRLPVPVADPLQAAYVPDADRLLVVAGATAGRPRLTLYDRSRSTWRALAWIDDVSRVVVDHVNRRVLFTRNSDSGLWQASLDLDPASVQPIAPLPTTGNYRSWSLDASGQVWLLEKRHRGCASWLRPLDEAAGQGRCLHRRMRPSPIGFSFAPRNATVYVALATYDDADIGFMILPAQRAAFVPGLLK